MFDERNLRSIVHERVITGFDTNTTGSQIVRRIRIKPMSIYDVTFFCACEMAAVAADATSLHVLE